MSVHRATLGDYIGPPQPINQSAFWTNTWLGAVPRELLALVFDLVLDRSRAGRAIAIYRDTYSESRSALAATLTVRRDACTLPLLAAFDAVYEQLATADDVARTTRAVKMFYIGGTRTPSFVFSIDSTCANDTTAGPPYRAIYNGLCTLLTSPEHQWRPLRDAINLQHRTLYPSGTDADALRAAWPACLAVVVDCSIIEACSRATAIAHWQRCMQRGLRHGAHRHRAAPNVEEHAAPRAPPPP